jgi:hypothetical protein
MDKAKKKVTVEAFDTGGFLITLKSIDENFDFDEVQYIVTTPAKAKKVVKAWFDSLIKEQV